MNKKVVQIIVIAMIILLALPVLIAPALSAELPSGEQVFESTCAGCHINGGNIIRRGKNLKQRAMEKHGYTSVESIAEIVANGKGNMSAYGDRLTSEEIQAVSEYVLAQSQKNWKS
ncbi:c-type cytochrome [[Limnothrix rosea] IAM M-220]|uniref:c-type cytochrome n=1 Tax=[Limnothrix rosea] IAM M-220 TaxID=454133 RepID=UPI000963EE3D|nr:c-type cytochrome [[Limnothrix rosea] IAM M-220]OKH12495.1 cytochrome C6 [[Limnothrix rosea] IAM M-220]